MDFRGGSRARMSKVLCASIPEEEEHRFEEEERSCTHFGSRKDEVTATERPCT